MDRVGEIPKRIVPYVVRAGCDGLYDIQEFVLGERTGLIRGRKRLGNLLAIGVAQHIARAEVSAPTREVQHLNKLGHVLHAVDHHRTDVVISGFAKESVPGDRRIRKRRGSSVWAFRPAVLNVFNTQIRHGLRKTIHVALIG